MIDQSKKIYSIAGLGSLKRRAWKGLTIGIAIGLLGAVFVLTPWGNDFEKEIGLTWLFKVRGPIEPPANVAVVAVNERAVKDLGLPALPRDWPRSIHGRLINRLTELGATAIVFDMDFQRPKVATDDLVFAKAVAASRRVVLFERLNGMRQPVLDINGRQVGTIWSEELVPPIPPLATAARALAPFPVPKVQVNIFQFWAFKPSAGDVATMPVAALQVYALDQYAYWRRLLGQAKAVGAEKLPRSPKDIKNAAEMVALMQTLRREFRNDPGLGERMMNQLGAAQGLNDRDRQLTKVLTRLYAGDDNRYLNFYGPPGTIPTIAYQDIIHAGTPGAPRVPNLAGKVVFVGFSDLYDPGQPDRFYTVFTSDDGVDLSGVEIAATAFANLSTDRSLTPTNTSLTVSLMLVSGLILGAGIYLLPALISVPLALLLTVLYGTGVQSLFGVSNLWLPLATPVLLQLPLALFVGLIAQYLLKRSGEQRLTKAVSYYLPENVAQQLTDHELDPSSLNKVVYGICFATDMSGFTTLSQSMDPSALAKFMNSYFDALAKALKQHHVDVNEFHADTIMSAWTADNPQTLERCHAPRAALSVVEAVTQFNQETNGVNLYARVGLDEGSFYLGHTGGGGRMGFSILGDCANTAARLESLNKYLNTHILASGPVVADDCDLLLRPVGRFVLKGKTEATPVIEVIAERSRATKSQIELCRRFAEAMYEFEQQQWGDATRLFEAVLVDFPDDGPSRFLLDLCRQYAIKEPTGEDRSAILMDAK